MGRFIVMDIVFYAGSLNYDQGSGSYQELKKITKWDGRQYTFVSRYALRYSLLETGRKLGLWEIAEGDSLSPEGKGDQKVIQPAEKLLYNGEILKYPEFDLFGYLITSTTPQNFREAPVKISHAVSMTPFNYDALFNANLGLANRLRKTKGDMKPNPFTSEEHKTFYQYSVVVDIERIGEIESYLQIKAADKKELTFAITDNKLNLFTIDRKKKERKNILSLTIEGDSYNLAEIILPITQSQVSQQIDKSSEQIKSLMKFNSESEVIVWKYKLKEKSQEKERIKNLIEAILNLHRSIKGRDEDLSPKLLILGLYKDTPYRTYRDKIILKDEYTEEEYDEIITEENDGKIMRKIIHKVSRSKKPIFEIVDGEFEEITLDKVADKVKNFIENSNTNNSSETYLAYTPEIEVKAKFKNSKGVQSSG